MDALEAVRPLLPAWVPFAALALWAPAAWLLAWACAGLARRVAIAPYRRLPPETPWMLRARHAYPARHATAFATVLSMSVLGALCFLATRPRPALSIVPAPVLVLLVCACAYLGGTVVSSGLAGELGLASRRVRALARDDFVVSVLLVPHFLLVVGVAPSIRTPLGATDALVFAGLALVLVAIAFGAALRLLGWLRLALPAPERVRTAVRAAAQALATPEPSVDVVHWGAANAFAFPLAGRLAFTSRALDVLDDDEIRAIALHEIGHLREPLLVRVARAAMLFALLPLAGIVAVLELAGPPGALALLAALFVLVRLFRRLARKMEQRADQVALCGADHSPVYARALERIYAANLAPAVVAGRSVHPPLYDRLVAAGAPPAYARPDPPSRKRLWAGVAAAIAPLVPAATLLAGLPLLLIPASVHSERASDLALALQPDAGLLLRRAMLEDALGHSDAALAFAAASTALEPDFIGPFALRATVLAREGRCEEAEQSFLQAEERNTDGAGDDWLVSAEAALETCAPRPDPARSPV